MALIGFPGRNPKIGHHDSIASNVLIIFRCHAIQMSPRVSVPFGTLFGVAQLRVI